MGKKSIKSLTELQEANADSDYLTPPEAVGISDLDGHERPMEALQPKNQKQIVPERLPQLHSSWREEDTAKYLREVSLQIQPPLINSSCKYTHVVTFVCLNIIL